MFYSVDSPGVFLHGRFKSSMNQAVSTECSLEGASSPPGGLSVSDSVAAPRALTSLHTLIHMSRSCLCMCVYKITTEGKHWISPRKINRVGLFF